MTIDDVTLMAFADGELTGKEHDAVAAAVESDPALHERIEMFRSTRQLTKQAFSAVPAPKDLEQRIRARAVEITAAQSEQPTVGQFRPRPRFWLGAGTALAASLVLGVFVGARLLQPIGVDQEAGTQFDLSPVRPMLATLASGIETELDNGARVTMIGSFRAGEDVLCREFEFAPGDTDSEGIAAISCFADGDWRLRLAVAAGVPDGENFAPATALDVLEGYLEAIDAGPILEADEEADALNALGQ